MEEVVFTSVGLLDLLSQIDELSEYDIDVTDNNGDITVSIGDSAYQISKPKDTVEIPEEAIAEISDIADDAISEVENSDTVVESGVIKEALKTLLVGGAVRLISKLVG